LYASSNTSNKIRIDDYLNNISLKFESPALKLAFLTYVKGKSKWIIEKERIFNEVSKQDYSRLPYLALLKTDYLLGKMEFSAALLALNYFKQHNKINGFACRIIQRMYWINLLEGKAVDKDFLSQMRAASKNSEDDVQAELELTYNLKYDRNLLLARILFDEGRIHESFQALKVADSTSTDWISKEYHYRKGRLFYQNNQLSQALQSFNYVRTLSKFNDLEYFGAYSCYYSAEIQHKMKNFTAALSDIKKAERYQQHAYVKSLGARLAYLTNQIKNDSPTIK
jgi:DNA-directed RNA polymerase beta subunit